MHRLIMRLFILLSALAVGCGDGDSDGGSTETDAATATASAAGDGGTGETFSSKQLPISVTVSPGAGFFVPEDADLPDLFVVVQTDFPNAYIDILQPTQVYTYVSATESELSSPPADYVQWFNELPFPSIVESQEVTVGGVQGTRLEIKNANNEDFALFKLSDGSDYDLDYLGSGAVFAYVLDAGGTQVVVICGTENASNFGEFARKTCEEVLAAVEFGT